MSDDRSPPETEQQPEDDVHGRDHDRPCPTFDALYDSFET